MEAEPALVGSDGAAELYPEASVDVDVALVILPGNPEDDDPLGFGDSIQEVGVPVSLVAFEYRPQGLEDLCHRLKKRGLARILLADPF